MRADALWILNNLASEADSAFAIVHSQSNIVQNVLVEMKRKSPTTKREAVFFFAALTMRLEEVSAL